MQDYLCLSVGLSLFSIGVLYHRWGKFEEAEKSYITALQIDPSAQQTSEHLRMLMKKLNKAS